MNASIDLTAEIAEPAEPIEASVKVDQPNPPPPPTDTPQTFKCDKCGATFADEGSAAAQIQTCKASGNLTSEDEEQAVRSNPTSPASVA